MQHNSCEMTTQKEVDWKKFSDLNLGEWVVYVPMKEDS